MGGAGSQPDPVHCADLEGLTPRTRVPGAWSAEVLVVGLGGLDVEADGMGVLGQ